MLANGKLTDIDQPDELRANGRDGSSWWVGADRPTFYRLVALRQHHRQGANAIEIAAVRRFIRTHGTTRVPAVEAQSSAAAECWRRSRG